MGDLDSQPRIRDPLSHLAIRFTAVFGALGLDDPDVTGIVDGRLNAEDLLCLVIEREGVSTDSVLEADGIGPLTAMRRNLGLERWVKLAFEEPEHVFGAEVSHHVADERGIDAPECVGRVEEDVCGVLGLAERPVVAASICKGLPMARNFKDLSRDGRMALALAAEEGGVTHRRLMKVAEGHPRDLTLLFQALLRKGLLERDRPGQGFTYHLAGRRPIPPEAPLFVPLRVEGSARSRLDPDGGSAQSPLDGHAGSAQKPSDGAGESTQSPPAPAGSTQRPSSAPLEATTVSAATPGPRWMTQAAMHAAILAACQGRFLTIAALAAAVGRSPRTVQRNYVRHLVADCRSRRGRP